MTKNNDFWKALNVRLRFSAIARFFSLLSIAVLFPIMEAIFVNLMTGADDPKQATEYGWCLFGIAVVHGILAIIQLIGEFASPEMQLAKAVEVQASFVDGQKELRRREHAYGMVRESLKLLTRQTCDLPREPQNGPEGSPIVPEMDWCQDGFEAGLKPIVAALTNDVATAMGVTSSRFAIEVHIRPDCIVGVESAVDQNGLCLVFFHSPSIGRALVSSLRPNESPAKIGEMWDVPNQQHIRENRAVFFSGESPNPEVYFRRFATTPILEPCSESRMGVLVLTSMQDEPFADDVLDTLQFIGSIVSNYVSSFGDCYLTSKRFKAASDALKNLEGEAKKELANAFGITINDVKEAESNHGEVK